MLGLVFLFKMKVAQIVLRLTTALRLVGELMRENKSHTLVPMVTVFLEKKIFIVRLPRSGMHLHPSVKVTHHLSLPLLFF